MRKSEVIEALRATIKHDLPATNLSVKEQRLLAVNLAKRLKLTTSQIKELVNRADEIPF